MDKIYEQTLLYDFYGELLNNHQRKVFEDAVFNDLSLSEVADTHSISRQAAHDLIKRVTNTLQGYEEKLHMISRFKKIEIVARRIRDISQGTVGHEEIDEIRKSSEEILDIMSN